MESEVYTSVMAMLSGDSDGSLKELLERIVKWEEENIRANDYHGFQWFEVYGDPRTLNSLVVKRILKITFKSNKCVMYRAVDLEAIKRALEDFEKTFEQVEVSEEIPRDLFKNIVGHEDKKDILIRSITSSSPVHALLWGSVASAKTLFLEELSRLPRSKFILGSSLTRAGIFDILFNDRPKYLIIDELDKVEDAGNLSALLSLMERGMVVEAKYKRYRTIRLKTWVFASANEIYRIPQELLSRFILLRFKEYTPEEYMEVVIKVLSENEGISEPLAAYIAEKVMDTLRSRDVRDSIKCARLLKERTREEVDKIISLMCRQR